MASSPNNGGLDFDDYGLGDPFDLDDIQKETLPKPTKDVVGIDDEITVTKRARAPAVKLDENRLLSANGIPKLKRRAKKIKFKGKGHEWSDASTLLSMYRLWLDDLYPKARFVDALAMVEKVGRKNTMIKQRNEWLEEGTKKYNIFDTVDAILAHGEESTKGRSSAAPLADIANRATSMADSFGLDNDIYGTSPKRPTPAPPFASAAAPADGAPPDFDDDLEAMMAEAEDFDANANKPEDQAPKQTLPPDHDYSAEDELMAQMPFDDY